MKTNEFVEQLPSDFMLDDAEKLEYDIVVDCDGSLNDIRSVRYDHNTKQIVIEVEGYY